MSDATTDYLKGPTGVKVVRAAKQPFRCVDSTRSGDAEVPGWENKLYIRIERVVQQPADRFQQILGDKRLVNQRGRCRWSGRRADRTGDHKCIIGFDGAPCIIHCVPARKLRPLAMSVLAVTSTIDCNTIPSSQSEDH